MNLHSSQSQKGTDEDAWNIFLFIILKHLALSHYIECFFLFVQLLLFQCYEVSAPILSVYDVTFHWVLKNTGFQEYSLHCL